MGGGHSGIKSGLLENNVHNDYQISANEHQENVQIFQEKCRHFHGFCRVSTLKYILLYLITDFHNSPNFLVRF